MTSPAGSLEPDREQFARFITAAFAKASEGAVSLRAFPDDKREGTPTARAVSLNVIGFAPLTDAAAEEAANAANAGRPMVLAPPVALFLGEKADEASLLEALTLSVELDKRAAEALATLRAVLGPPTFVVASGGSWTDPATGDVQTWYLDHARRRFGASSWRVAQAPGRAVFDRRTVAYGSVANLERQGLVRRTIRPRRGNLLGVVAYHGVILERVRACGLNFLWTHDPLASASNRGLRACRARRLRGERAAVLAQIEAEERLHVLTELGRAALVAAEMAADRVALTASGPPVTA